MGTWGTSLYANDQTKDIRDDYIELLREGKSGAEASDLMKQNNADMMQDPDEASLFWYALADTQWDYGRLQPDVKEKALFYLTHHRDQRWEEAGPAKEKAWEETLARLQEKLLSEQPPEKKLRKSRMFRCEWELGSVFAYRFTTDYSKEKGVYNKYVVFRKVSEDSWYPKHIIPIVQFYQWVGDRIPNLEEIQGLDTLPTYHKEAVEYIRTHENKNYVPKTEFELVATSKKQLPADQLTYLGSILGEDLAKFRGFKIWTGTYPLTWETAKGYHNWRVEKTIIDLMISWGVIIRSLS